MKTVHCMCSAVWQRNMIFFKNHLTCSCSETIQQVIEMFTYSTGIGEGAEIKHELNTPLDKSSSSVYITWPGDSPANCIANAENLFL